MSDIEAKIKIVGEESVSDVAKKVAEALGDSTLGRAVTAAGAGMAGLSATFDMAGKIIGKVTEAFEKFVAAGLEADRADRQIVQSLSLVGEYSKEAFQGIDDFASGLEALTGISDESTKGLISLGMNLGMTAEQAKKAAEAAINFGAATGQSAETVLRQLNNTLQGTAGKLGLQVGLVGTLTKAQLANGDAIDILNSKYKDFAANNAKSLEGAIHHVQVAFGNIIEEMSKFLTQNDLVFEAVNAVAHALAGVADAVKATRTFFQENAVTIREWADAAAAVAIVVGTVAAALYGVPAAIAVVKASFAALTLVMNANPFVLLGTVIGVTLVAAFKYFNIGVQEVIGAMKMLIGAAITPVTFQIGLLLKAIGAAVGIMDKEWGEAIQGTADKIMTLGTNLVKTGADQIAASQAAKEHAEAMEQTTAATRGLETQLTAAQQAVNKMGADFSRALAGAKTAMDQVKDFAPEFELNEWNQNYALFKKQLEDLSAKSIKIKATIESQGGPQNAEQQAMYQQAIEAHANAQAAIKGLEMKNASEVREHRIKEVDLALQYEYQKTISVTDEIYLKRIAAAEQLRAKQVELATQRIMDEEGIERHGIDVTTQARLAANEQDLKNYQEHLNAQMALAVDMETQKQQALAQAKASATSGLGGPAEAGGAADATIANENARQQQLQMLREQDLMNEEQYQQAMTQSRINQANARMMQEVAIEKQRSQMLGLSDEGIAARLEKQKLEDEMYLNQLRMRHENQQLTDQQFQIAQQQAAIQHEANMAQVRQQAIQQEIQQAQLTRDTWRGTLAQIRLEQERHGQIMGTIKGIQNSQQMAALQTTLSETSTMMQTGNKEQFEIGKAAAIAQASINTFLAATGAIAALSKIPIVGPALGIAAASFITMAGMLRINQIRQTQYNGKGGQADEGMESVPHSLSGRSFILAGGERVVATNQNKELGAAIDKINSGQINNSNEVNINIAGSADKDTVAAIKDSVIDVLRDSSERGRPIINQRGVTST